MVVARNEHHGPHAQDFADNAWNHALLMTLPRLALKIRIILRLGCYRPWFLSSPQEFFIFSIIEPCISNQ